MNPIFFLAIGSYEPDISQAYLKTTNCFHGTNIKRSTNIHYRKYGSKDIVKRNYIKSKS
jgi:hypothetical protein